MYKTLETRVSSRGLGLASFNRVKLGPWSGKAGKLGERLNSSPTVGCKRLNFLRPLAGNCAALSRSSIDCGKDFRESFQPVVNSGNVALPGILFEGDRGPCISHATGNGV